MREVYIEIKESSRRSSVNIDQEEWVSLLSDPTHQYFHSLLFADSKVIQVRASDKDADGDPDNPAGKIVYSIVSTHKHFKIHPETGWLSTNKVSLDSSSQSYFVLFWEAEPAVSCCQII